MGACLFASVICAILLLKDVLGISLPRRCQEKDCAPGATLEKCVQWLNEEKCLPLAAGSHWQLWGNHSGLRLWRHRRSDDKHWPTIIAVSARIKASSQHLFGFVKDVERFGEWRCNLLEVVRHAPLLPTPVGGGGPVAAGPAESASAAFASAAPRASGADCLTLTRAWRSGHCLAVDAALAAILPVQCHVFDRCWQTEANRVHWVLEASRRPCAAAAGKHMGFALPDFTFYIMQPVVSLENDQSVLTVITTRPAMDVAQDVCCISDFFISGRSRVQPVGPLTWSSCLADSAKLWQQQQQQAEHDRMSRSAKAGSDAAATTATATSTRNTNNSSASALVPATDGQASPPVTPTTRSPLLPARRNVAVDSGSASPFEDSGEQISFSARRSSERSDSQSRFDQYLDVVEADTDNSPGDSQRFSAADVFAQRPTATPDGPTAAPLPPVPSLSAAADTGGMLPPALGSADDLLSSSTASGKESFASLEAATDAPAEAGLIDYRTLSNQCAADVMAEVFRASSITPQLRRRLDADDGSGGQVAGGGSTDGGTGSGPTMAASCFGWTFQSIEKDVVILRKHSLDLAGCSESYLGKGLIKASPDAVWQCVSNPKIRFLHDDLLKAADVVADMGGGMKLVRLYYEASHLLRRRRGPGGADSHEFYVLQSERRLDGDKDTGKRLLCLHSVDCPEPKPKDTPRGKFYSSGWLIEPVPRKDRRGGYHTMVTYLSQIQLDTDAAASLHEEIIAKQPLSICALREYLALPVAAV